MKLENAFVFILIVFMFVLPFSYANAGNSQEIKYKNWTVDFFIDDIIRYSTNGTNVNGHKFGWLIKPGACDVDVLYLAISTYKCVDILLAFSLANSAFSPSNKEFIVLLQIPNQSTK